MDVLSRGYGIPVCATGITLGLVDAWRHRTDAAHGVVTVLYRRVCRHRSDATHGVIAATPRMSSW
jgi:hypothetical protein